MFAVLHADPALLLRAELTLKLHQVEHAPRAPLFVNLDPDSWTRAGDRNRNPFLALFASSNRARHRRGDRGDGGGGRRARAAR